MTEKLQANERYIAKKERMDYESCLKHTLYTNINYKTRMDHGLTGRGLGTGVCIPQFV